MATPLLSPMFLISTLLFVSSSLSLATNPTSFNMTLSLILTKRQPSDAIKTIHSLASSSSTRAHPPKSEPPLTKTKVYEGVVGGSISLNFGTPPQTISFILDTGSSPVWFPCTSHYICQGCDIDPRRIPLFFPERSSSSKFIDCQNRNCPTSISDFHGCDCSLDCSYSIGYDKGGTLGVLLSETLSFPEKRFTNILVGCSTSSTNVQNGIAGFGRTKESLPSQLGLSKFSYCLNPPLSHDGFGVSDLVMYRGSSSDARTPGMSYTKFVKNSAFPEFYYVVLLKVTVGSQTVDIPDKYISPENNADGNGGTIVDSGYTYTTMDPEIFHSVVLAFESQMSSFGNFFNVPQVASLFNSALCYNISGSNFMQMSFPKLTFEFYGGAKMELPKENYFDPHLVCLDGHCDSYACLTLHAQSTHDSGGASFILGNTQQHNFLVEFDLENDRFGFRKQTCNKK